MDNEKLTAGQVEEIGKPVVKKKRSRPDRTVQTEPGDNTKYIRHSLELAELPKVDIKDNEQVKERVVEFFRICEKNDMKPSVSGLAVALGIDRVYLWELRTGAKGKNPDVANTLKRACSLLDQQMVDYMQNGKINPVAGIFLLKNSGQGYADKTEVVVSPAIPLGDQSDENALADRYNDAVVVDDFEDVTDGRPENG